MTRRKAVRGTPAAAVLAGGINRAMFEPDSEVFDRKIGPDGNGDLTFESASGRRRTYCHNCGVALDVGGGCGTCRSRKIGGGS